MVEEKAKMMNNILNQARQLLVMLTDNSESELVKHADEFLLFLNNLFDASEKYSQIGPLINSTRDIIYGLESNPEQTLHQPDVRARLTSLFTILLRKIES